MPAAMTWEVMAPTLGHVDDRLMDDEVMEDGHMHEPVEVVEAYCDAWLAGDTKTVVGLYHPDLTLIWPGHHRLAGTHEGIDASVTALLDLQTVTNRRPILVEQILVGADSVMATVIERWTANATDGSDARTLELRRVLEWTVLAGTLRTCRIFESAQGAIDAWIGPEAA